VFDNLIESKRKRSRSFVQSLTSLVVHGALIFAAITVTKGAAEAVAERVIDTTMMFIKPPEPPPPPPQETPPDVVVSQNPPPKGFQTVVPPKDIPTEIPPVDMNQKPFDPKDFSGKGVEGGVFKGVEGATGPVNVEEAVYTAVELDDPARPISQPSPRYPPVLQSAGIAGRVELQYIVDTTGRAEPGSIKIINSTHKAFEEPAKETVLKSTFKPARFRGQPVRQLVQQAMSFKIGG